MSADYIFTRKDGGTTHCYGKVADNSNFEIVCADEAFDAVYAEGNPDRGDSTFHSWREVCTCLEHIYNTKIEELVAV